MRSRFCLVGLSFGLLLSSVGQSAEPFRYKPGKTGKGELKYLGDIPVLVLQGTPEEKGEQGGVLAVRHAKPLFRFPYDYFVAESRTAILKKHPEATDTDAQVRLELELAKLAWPLVQRKAASLVKNLPESHPYRKELKAITDAAGKSVVSHEELVAGNGLFDMGHVPLGELPRGCSSLIVPPQLSATGGLLFGRNLDFSHFGYLHHFSLLIVYRAAAPEKTRSFVSAGFPGLVGCFTGMNDAGLAIASHQVQAPNTATPFNPKGVPFALAYRRVLEECATVGDALKLLDSLDRASVTSLVIADPSGGAVIEVTPDSLAIRRFKDKPGVCTNHFCTMKTPNLVEQFDTIKRFDSLTASATQKQDGGFGVADVHKAMHAVRLFDPDKVDMTIQTFVFEPAARKIHLSFGNGTVPATSGKLTTVDLKELWGGK